MIKKRRETKRNSRYLINTWNILKSHYSVRKQVGFSKQRDLFYVNVQHWSTNFPKMLKPRPNSRHQKGDIPSWGVTI